MISMSWDGLSRLHRIVGHLLEAASEIDDLGPNAVDWEIVSRELESVCGVSLFLLRDCCNELNRIEKSERERVEMWYEEHGISDNRTS